MNIYRLWFKNLVEIRLGFGNVVLKFHWNVSGKMSKRAGMPFMKSNGECEFIRRVGNSVTSNNAKGEEVMKKTKIKMPEGFTRRDALKLYGVALGALATGKQKRAFGTNNELKMTLPNEKELKMTFPNEPKSRIAPLSTDNLSPECLKILERLPGKGLQGEGFPYNLLGILMYNPDTLETFLDYWVTSKAKMGLAVREQELVILRMAVLYRSEYVWKHHVKVGREFGVNDTELDAIRHGSYAAFSAARERALLELTDAFMNERSLSQKLWNKTKDVLDPRDFVDLISLVSQYVLFALNNVCMQVQVEPGVEDMPGIEG
jgi:4-carboxymuconolactone decarboxylase